MQSSWAEAHSQALREYLEKGLTYSEIIKTINERFDTDYTRSAAIGRARRMGLSGSKQLAPDARPKILPQPRLERLNKLRARLLTEVRLPRAVRKRAAALQLRCVGIVPRHLSLLELEDGDCRYPFGGDEDGEAITFCGHPRRQGSSYCTSHFYLTSGDFEGDQRTAPAGPGGRVRLRLVEAA
jgi:GcrA cell cycle regulator